MLDICDNVLMVMDNVLLTELRSDEAHLIAHHYSLLMSHQALLVTYKFCKASKIYIQKEYTT